MLRDLRTIDSLVHQLSPHPTEIINFLHSLHNILSGIFAISAYPKLAIFLSLIATHKKGKAETRHQAFRNSVTFHIINPQHLEGFGVTCHSQMIHPPRYLRGVHSSNSFFFRTFAAGFSVISLFVPNEGDDLAALYLCNFQDGGQGPGTKTSP